MHYSRLTFLRKRLLKSSMNFVFLYYLALEKGWHFIWTKLNSHHPRMLCQVWLKLVKWIWKRKFLNVVYVLLLLRIWTNLIPFNQNMFCVRFVWNWSRGSGKKDVIFSSMYCCFFVIISPWKRTWSFIWTNLNPLHPRMCFP